MPDLTEAMRQATEALPPSRIDLDSLIEDHYRRARRQRGLAVAGGALAVVAALAAGQLIAAGPKPQAGVGPAPTSRPTTGGPTSRPPTGEPTTHPPASQPSTLLRRTIAERLSTALRLALESALPSGATVSPPPTFAWDQKKGGYIADFTVTDAQGRPTAMNAIVMPEWPTPPRLCSPVPNDPSPLQCEVVSLPDGSRMISLWGDDASDGGTARATRASERLWPNTSGQTVTLVFLSEQAARPGLDRLPLDRAALDALAALPALHLNV